MIDVVGVSKRITDGFAIKNVEFKVGAGQIVGLLGPNGAGKSSLIRLLTGIYQPDQGTIRLNGLDPHRSMLSVRLQVGTVIDRLPLYPWLSVMEFLGYFARLYQLSEWEPRAIQLLRSVGLDTEVNKRVTQLSNGMKQRLNFARALLHYPAVLLLDEPTLGLDPISVSTLAEHIGDFASRGGAVLLCSHDLTFVARLCSTIFFLNDGQVSPPVRKVDVPTVYVIDFRLSDSNDHHELCQELRRLIPNVAIEHGVESCLRVEYEARHGESVHQAVLNHLLAHGARIAAFSSDPIRGLESLYGRTVQVRSGGKL